MLDVSLKPLTHSRMHCRIYVTVSAADLAIDKYTTIYDRRICLYFTYWLGHSFSLLALGPG